MEYDESPHQSMDVAIEKSVVDSPPEPSVSRPTPNEDRAPSSSIRDNHTRGSIGDFLSDKIRSGSLTQGAYWFQSV